MFEITTTEPAIYQENKTELGGALLLDNNAIAPLSDTAPSIDSSLLIESQTNNELNNLTTNNLKTEPVSSADTLTGKTATDLLVGEENSTIALETPQQLDTFESRSQKLLEQFTTTNVKTSDAQYSKYAFWYAQALFHNGAIDQARATIDQAHQRPFDDYSFYYWGAIDSYFRWKDLYTEPQKATAKQIFTDATIYDTATTENHKIMLAVARYLASEEWPDEVFAGNYSTSDSTGKNQILEMMSDFVSQGMVEHDSPVYHAFYLGAFRTLADFAKDAEIKQKAEIVFEWLLINPSGEWLDGHWAASSLRKFPYVHRQNEYGAGQYSLWLFYGGAEPTSFSVEAAYAVQHAVSDYHAPNIIQDIATDRQQEYVHRAYDRWGGFNNDRFYKTTYMASEGAIYSQFEELGDPLGWSDQSHRWGVVWTDSNQDSTFWVTHPKKGPNADNKSRGITDYEQVLQHNKTIVGVYNIPANDPYKYVIGKTPQGFIDYIDRSDRGEIYLDYGNVKIALSLFTIGPNGEKIGFDWSPQDTEFQGPSSIAPGKLKIGLVATVAFRGEYANLNEFANAVNFQENINYSQILDKRPRIQYTAPDGHLLDIRFDRHLRVDNQDLDPQSWPLMENPWITQSQAGNLQLNYGSRQREYIFGPNEWQVKTNGIVEQNGQLKIEAENFIRQDRRLDSVGSDWTLNTAQTGYLGSGYLRSDSTAISTNRDFNVGAEISYDIVIQNPGTYNIWVRRYATDKTNNSLYFGIDGQQVGGVDNVRVFNEWTWEKIGAIDLESGPHSLELRRREAGYQLDSILLTTSLFPPVI